MLQPYFPQRPQETLLSYACRLAYLHTGQGLPRLLGDLRISQADFVAADPEAVQAFADAVGGDAGILAQSGIRLLHRYNVFRGEDFSRSFLPGRVVQFCPECLAEQGGRENWSCLIAWSFASVPICSRHACLMTFIEEESFLDLRQMGVPTAGISEPVTVGAHVRWLEARLAGKPVSGWLRGQTIEQVLHSSEMLGMVLQHGEQVRPNQLSRRQRSEAMEVGFLVYRDGEQAIQGALCDIRRNAVAHAVQAGPLATFGPLFDWLDRRANLIDPGPIKAILREHILEHEAWAPGEMLLGQPVEERRLHSVKSLSEALKTDRRRMSRLLQKLGLVPEGATDAESGRLVFRVQEIEQLVEDYQNAVPLARVPEYLGGSQNMVQALYGAGMLQAVIPADAPGAVRGVLFARRELNNLLAKLEALPVLEGDGRSRAILLSDACQRYGLRAGDALVSILAGKLAAGRCEGLPSLHAVLVDKAAFLEFRDGLRALS